MLPDLISAVSGNAGQPGPPEVRRVAAALFTPTSSTAEPESAPVGRVATGSCAVPLRTCTAVLPCMLLLRYTTPHHCPQVLSPRWRRRWLRCFRASECTQCRSKSTQSTCLRGCCAAFAPAAEEEVLVNAPAECWRLVVANCRWPSAVRSGIPYVSQLAKRGWRS